MSPPNLKKKRWFINIRGNPPFGRRLGPSECFRLASQRASHLAPMARIWRSSWRRPLPSLRRGRGSTAGRKFQGGTVRRVSKGNPPKKNTTKYNDRFYFWLPLKNQTKKGTNLEGTHPNGTQLIALSPTSWHLVWNRPLKRKLILSVPSRCYVCGKGASFLSTC